jgi:ABC-type dipeptide/oligopeptide/nickel transport system permease subunit
MSCSPGWPATSAAWWDRVVMRSVDLVASLPTIPLWMALAAAVPRNWSIVATVAADAPPLRGGGGADIRILRRRPV